MDAFTLLILVRGVLSFCLILGGIYALKKGFQLYVTASGLADEGVAVGRGKESASANVALKRVGSVVMVTACAWGYLAYLVMPQRVTTSSGYAHSSINETPIEVKVEARSFRAPQPEKP